jgi:fatty-acyl-CoA synthase
VVVPAPGSDAKVIAAELPAFAKDQLANFKVPRRVEVVDVLPTNASGKVLKRELRTRFGT